MEHEVRNVGYGGSVIAIPRQTASEVREVISFLLEEWQDLRLTRNYMAFNSGYPFYMSLAKVYILMIYGTLVTNDKAFILCLNGTLYIYSRESRNLEIQLPLSISWAYGTFGLRCEMFRLNLLLKYYRITCGISERFRMEKDFWLECICKDPACLSLFLLLLVALISLLVTLCFW